MIVLLYMEIRCIIFSNDNQLRAYVRIVLPEPAVVRDQSVFGKLAADCSRLPYIQKRPPFDDRNSWNSLDSRNHLPVLLWRMFNADS